MLPSPQALLLDFGGVIADGPTHPEWRTRLAEDVNEVLAEAGVTPLPPAEILAAVDGEEAADHFWQEPAPEQPDHATMWGEIVAAGWSAAARTALADSGELLSRRFIEHKHALTWQLRPGMAELLANADQHGLPVAIVSNTLCAGPHREFLTRLGLDDRFTGQFYSDEHGVRKPNPELVAKAVAAVSVPPEGCWFVGDTLTRDILVARRANLGAAVLMRSQRSEPAAPPDGVAPDAVVADPVELSHLLDQHGWAGEPETA
ncbi:HAD family hydrolase [Natronosporangium hydrolyticum]|uniref:HAD family hydrolase n=1 Tax=Natronosporangium hydrolyticum TaxID=2811111 RepID=A0A895YKC1_9ACTN|nr:HAD family hydrolase [Natronosporangium hydrolyticum]QSB16482.1 HAD family hydrolase [Natronosporangium hydrolyticum]